MNTFITLLLLSVFVVDATTDLESHSANICSHAFFSKSKAFSAPSTSNRCIWRITVPPQEKILLNITDLDIPKTPNCTRGHVEIRDGYWYHSPLLGKFCGKSRLNPIVSTTNKMLISYVNDNAAGGFSAAYESICGKALFVEDAANFSSPNYPDLYPNKEKCYWTVAVPEDRRVALTFEDFDVEFGINCSYDYVQITDGPSVYTFCNQRRPPSPFIANGSFVLVKFLSDFSVQKSGFLVFVEGVDLGCSTTNHGCAQECRNTVDGYVCACWSGYYLHPNGKDCVEIRSYECGGNSTLPSTGVRYSITSPLYPSPYPSNASCIWNISTLMHESRIRLTFNYFDLEEGIRPDRHSNSTDCNNDWLRVFSTGPNDFTSSSRLCFGNNTVQTPLINQGTYCGRINPEPVLSVGNNLSIVFQSDMSVERGGFLLQYESELQGCMINNGNCFHRCDDSHGNASCVCASGATLQSNNRDCLTGDCAFEIASLSGFISTPNYPNDYPVNKECSWAFKTTPGHRLNITFVDFSLERRANCLDGDYVTLYDDSYFRGPVLGHFCGDLSQFQLNSSNNGLYVKFRSDNGIRSRGFRALYSTVCGGNLTADSSEKYIYSHANFGYGEYDNNVDCEWTIKAHNKSVILSFLSFSLEGGGSTCYWDYVQIFEKRNSTLLNLSERYCSFNKPPPLCATSDTVVVRFKTDSSVTSEGFSLVYKAN